MTTATATAAPGAERAPRVAPGHTRIALVPDNVTAFAVRCHAARTATRTLDLQYYMWHEDVTGQALAREVLAAADRGVRVRMLLDDLYVRRTERALAALTCHHGVEVRLYNPFQLREWGKLGDITEFLFASYRLNHRMHNKAWIADRRLAVCGGRNIGDEYFDASGQFNFRDMDMVVSGEAVKQASAVFERYWTNRRVRPIASVATLKPTPEDLVDLRRTLDNVATMPAATEFQERVQHAPAVLDHATEVATADVRVVSDPPGKGGRGRGSAPVMLTAVRGALSRAQRSILLISPYFVPGPRGARQLQRLSRDGVGISVLTNSLAATDVLAVHGGYAHYRRRLLRAGVSLHELKPGGRQGQSLFGSGRASLHTKAFVIDDELVFVGSFNLDPRSAYLNTEMGIFVRHPGLAADLRQEFERMTDPAHSWSVKAAGLRLAWTDEIDGRPRTLRHEPDSSPARRIIARILGWLPLEPEL